MPNGQQRYRFKLRPGILFHSDPSFALSQKGRLTREVTAADIAFQFARLADPAVNSPVAGTFADVLGFAAFGKRLAERRKADPAFAALPVHEQYKAAGGIEGVVVTGDREIEFILAAPNPQLLYWFAMPFTTPMAWEAVAYYDGKEGRPNLADRAVGTGPFRLALYEKQHRFTLARNETWYGRTAAPADAPGAFFPTEIDKEDIDAKRIDPAYAGRRLPFLDEIRFTREKESIPRFNKFLQGYYDDSGIIKESFDAVIVDGDLSPEMKERGIRLDKEVEPSVFYIGFNMEDPVVGAPAGDKGRKLRQAMSLAIDAQEYLRLFTNGRGVPAQTPLPPGLFGYDKDYRNPFRQPDLERARELLAEAGYKNGIDPATGQPSEAQLRRGQHRRRGAAAIRAPRGGMAPDRPGCSDQRHDLQPVPGQGAARRLSDLPVGVDRRLPRSGELPVPADLRERALEEQRPQHGRLLQCRVRRSLPRHEGPAQQQRARAADRAHGEDPGDRAPLDRALPPRGLRPAPRLGRELQVHGHLGADPTSTRT